MGTVNFFIKGSKNPTSIYLRFRYGRKIDVTRSTGYLIDPFSWNRTKKMPYPRTAHLKKLSTDLLQLSHDVIVAFNGTSLNEIDNDWLRQQIKNHRGDINNDLYKEELLTVQIQKLIDESGTRENALGGYGLSKSRRCAYATLKKLVSEFQGRERIIVRDIDMRFGKEFLSWMINEKQYSQSYSRKKLDDIKTVCRNAQIYGIPISPQLDHIKTGKYKSNQILYLKPSELKLIEEADLESPALKNARKWLLLGCMIGQRGGDLLSIRDENFVTKMGQKMIELTQQKTGKHVYIPILTEVEDIIEEGLPYPISLQKFNEHIKEICRLSEINDSIEGYKYNNRLKRKVKGNYPKYELITSHVCRRSFATNLYGELSAALIMQITGHSTEKMLLQYIGKGAIDYAQQIAEFYIKQEIKRKKEPRMDVLRNAINN